jgi:hypothetical protein
MTTDDELCADPHLLGFVFQPNLKTAHENLFYFFLAILVRLNVYASILYKEDVCVVQLSQNK